MEERFKVTKKAGIYGMLGNIFLLIIKAIVGFSSKSQAMIADSINSFGDIFDIASSIMSISVSPKNNISLLFTPSLSALNFICSPDSSPETYKTFP